MKKKEIIYLAVFIAIVLAVQGISMFHPTVHSGAELLLCIDESAQEPAEEESLSSEDEEFELDEEDVLEPDKFQKFVEPLSLELLGTAIGNIKDPIAFIKDLETGKQGIYRLGSKVQDATVIVITRGEVVLEREGIRESLFLSTRGRRWANTAESSDTIVELSADNKLVNKNSLVKQVSRLYKELKAVKITPHSRQDKTIGLRVEEVGEGSIIAAAGIRSNDVITSVNGQQVNSYQKALQIGRKLRGASNIKVGLLRNGESKVLTYRVR